MSDRFRLVPEVHLFLLDWHCRVLLLRRSNTDYENGNYSVVAGHVEANEPVTAAAIREAGEEVGIQVQPSDLEVVGVIHRRADEERVSFFLTASAWIGDIVNAEPNLCDDLSWHSIESLLSNTISYLKRALGSYQDGTFFDEFGWHKHA